MKKSIFIISGLVILIVGMLVLIFTDKIIENSRIITVDTLNSYLYNKDQKIEIAVFLNDKNFPIDNLNSYNEVYVSNIDESNKINLEIIEVTYAHDEVFVNEIFSKYYLKFKMPNLEKNYSIIEAFLNINFINNSDVSLKIGEFHLNYLDEYNLINWLSINSKKENVNDYYISQIIIEFDQKYLNINNVYIANDHQLEFTTENNKLIIEIEDLKLVQTYLPLWIETNTKTYYFNNYHYSLEYNLLENAERLINIYDFN